MDSNQIRLSQAIEGYFLAAQARRLAPGTLADYDNTFHKFETFLGRDPPLAEITPGDIRDFLNSVDDVSAKTLLNYHVGLSALWTWARKERLVDRHIVHHVDRPEPEQREIVPYTERDIKAMLSACERSRRYARPGKRECDHSRPTALRDRAILLLLLDTGIRVSELCHLRLAEVDLPNRRVTVMGKGRKERILPISSRTAQSLWRYLATRGEDHAATEPLFSTGNGHTMSRYSVYRLINRLGDRAAVPGANVHRFRHTFGIAFLRNGGQIFALQRILGHATLEMVRRYLAIAQADVERAHQHASPVANWRL
jgi:site-specific recombinase XerD